MRIPFAVGKVTRKTSEIVVVRPKQRPFPGPWTLKALVRPTHKDRQPTQVH